MLLSDEEVWGLATKCDMALAPASAIWAIREAVRIAAERCAQICEEIAQQYPISGGGLACAAAIREAVK